MIPLDSYFKSKSGYKLCKGLSMISTEEKESTRHRRTKHFSKDYNEFNLDMETRQTIYLFNKHCKG